MNKQAYTVLEDRVLIRPIKETDVKVTTGGIIDPNVKPKPTMRGEVVASGAGFTARDTGLFVQAILNEGDMVIYGSGAGVPVEVETESGVEELLIMREGDVFMVLPKKNE